MMLLNGITGLFNLSRLLFLAILFFFLYRLDHHSNDEPDRSRIRPSFIQTTPGDASPAVRQRLESPGGKLSGKR